MEIEPLEINCKHGKGIAALVCGHHLASTQPIGFIDNNSIPNDLQAWCYACEYVFERENEMNDGFRKFSRPVVVCEECYKEFKNLHSTHDLS